MALAMARRGVMLGCSLALGLAVPAAGAQPSPSSHGTPPAEVSGVERPGREQGDAWREAGNVALFVPRNIVDYTFRGTALAARLVAEEQLVPRLRELFGGPNASIFVFPTLFIETGNPASVGVRMIADSRRFATSQRLGFGGLDNVEVESRVLFKSPSKVLPVLAALESYYKLEDSLEYWGLGVEPRLDARNRYRAGTGREFGRYAERKVRALGSLGLRLSDNIELFLSASITRRQLGEDVDHPEEAVGAVFAPGSVPGFAQDSYIGYAEAAARFDSRRLRTRPSPGVVLEAYAGGARAVQGDPAAFMRVGWRAGGFVSVYRRTNILAPRLVFDRVIPLGGLTVPFTELARQPEFRGFDRRRDQLSIVGSLDYSWELVPFLGMRLFLDAATVAPSLTEAGIAQIQHLRYVGGVGIDLFNDTSELGRLAIAVSPEGARVLASVGVPSGYGDRQHRD